MMGGYGDGWWLLMWVWMAVFWLLVIAGVVWLVWRVQRPVRDSSEAEEILKQRLARGEIDVEQYRALARELDSDSRTSPRRPRGGDIAVVLLAVLAVSAFFAAPALAATRGNWDMFDHMGGMMGGGRNTANAPLTIGATAATVTMENLAFSPGNLQVPVGATVTWTNRDSAPHNATARDGSWKTDTLSEGESGTVTFNRAGEYDYYCTIHPSMKAHLSVR
jgi:plastocyanin